MIETVSQTPQAPAPQGQGQPQRRGYGSRKPEAENSQFKETMVALNRVAKVVKGGKRFSFSSLMVVGDRQGSVGCGLGKAKEVQAAIQKGVANARKDMIRFPIQDGTIPHEVTGHFGAGKVWMKPAAPGTGVIAGSGVRAVLEAAGIKNILTKSLGSSNCFNMVYATLDALSQLRSVEQIQKLRGK